MTGGQVGAFWNRWFPRKTAPVPTLKRAKRLQPVGWWFRRLRALLVVISKLNLFFTVVLWILLSLIWLGVFYLISFFA